MATATISPKEASDLFFQHTGKRGNCRPLPGDSDLNFYVKAEDGSEFTLKISHPETNPSEIDLQNSIMEHLVSKNSHLEIPAPYRFTSGYKINIGGEGAPRWLRMQSWVKGKPLGSFKPRGNALSFSWGVACGKLSLHLQDFDHPGTHRRYEWDPSNTLDSRPFLVHFRSETERDLGNYFWDLFENQALPKLPHLRKSVNHNDAHELNLLITPKGSQAVVSGVIDFGDAVYTHTINELAIASAYVGMHMNDPLSAICQAVKGYHSVFPLEENELEVLYEMIAARLMITVAMAAERAVNSPGNAYQFLSQQPAWDLLAKWRKISPALAHYAFREACGLEACPKNVDFQSWAQQNKKALTFPIAGEDAARCQMDLQVGSLDLGNHSTFENIHHYQRRIQEILSENNALLGQGGYLEIRPFYSSDAYQEEGNEGPRWRSLHLGVDFWSNSGTEVYACYAGRIHSLQNNEGKDNYGPTIILEHQVTEDLCFYSLYGHLSEESLLQKKKGDRIAAGDCIGSLGTPKINGGWPPHLHFQLILDLLGEEGDFPGVAHPDQKELWRSICPYPGFFFEIPSSEAPDNDESLLHFRKKHLGKSLSLLYTIPLHIVSGYMQHLYDRQGQRYLDTANNVAHVGHEHPRVVRAGQRQMAVLNTNSRYLHRNILSYAEELLKTFPPSLSVCHFVNSGSEANELALRMAKAASGGTDTVAVEVGYHGNTNAVIDVSSYKFDGKGGKGKPPRTHLLPRPDTYRGIYRDPALAGQQYASHMEAILETMLARGGRVSSFIVEGILSCGGQIELPQGYLTEVFRQIREAGGYCIVDEVQTGFGRVGSHFWAFERSGVVPDIVTLGKPIGNGHPLGAVICTQEVAEAFANGMEFFNTFGGNPVSMAIGREVLKTVQEEGLQAQALRTGNHLKEGFRQLAQEHPLIGHIRGQGLFLGVELVTDRESRNPAGAACSHLANRLAQQNVLIGTDGPDHNVIKIKPPMCFGIKDADQLLNRMDAILREDYFR